MKKQTVTYVWIDKLFEPVANPLSERVKTILERTPGEALQMDAQNIGKDFYNAMDKALNNVQTETTGKKRSAGTTATA